MHNNSLVSVILPFYNEEKYIKSCIQSILKQKYKNFEIIAVDDGSSDKSSIIISKFKNVQIFKTRHLGTGHARNYGVKVAKGSILLFLDADMSYHHDYVNNIIKPILLKKSQATYSLSEFVSNYSNIWSKCWQINSGFTTNRRINPINESLSFVFRAIEKKVFNNTSGFDSQWGYFDDRSLAKYKFKNIYVTDAYCYHNNPDTLIDVFLSARWIGRGKVYYFSFKNILKYSIFNSIRIGIKRIIYGAPLRFLIFKIIFDLGIINGILDKNKKKFFSK